MAQNLRDRGWSSSMDNYNQMQEKKKREQEKREKQEKQNGPASVQRYLKLPSAENNMRVPFHTTYIDNYMKPYQPSTYYPRPEGPEPADDRIRDLREKVKSAWSTVQKDTESLKKSYGYDPTRNPFVFASDAATIALLDSADRRGLSQDLQEKLWQNLDKTEILAEQAKHNIPEPETLDQAIVRARYNRHRDAYDKVSDEHFDAYSDYRQQLSDYLSELAEWKKHVRPSKDVEADILESTKRIRDLKNIHIQMAINGELPSKDMMQELKDEQDKYALLQEELEWANRFKKSRRLPGTEDGNVL